MENKIRFVDKKDCTDRSYCGDRIADRRKEFKKCRKEKIMLNEREKELFNELDELENEKERLYKILGDVNTSEDEYKRVDKEITDIVCRKEEICKELDL